MQTITDGFVYLGVDDLAIDLFEAQYDVREQGISYNSYLILDDKVAVMDAVDAHFGNEWIAQLEQALGNREPDYLVVHHMEPDHSGSIARFIERFPEARIVASAMAFRMMKAYFGTDFPGRTLTVKNGDTLDLGTRTLTFIGAPGVHWPEVLFSYVDRDRTLFSADAFGRFGALGAEGPTAPLSPEDWADEARRYYAGIVGKFGKNVRDVLEKIAAFDVERICPLHGPVLSGDLAPYLERYARWANYEPEEPGIVIAYASVYGHLEQAALELADALGETGLPVETFDLVRDDQNETLAATFRYDRAVFAATTYCGGVFPAMATFLNLLAEHRLQKRTVGIVQGGSWAPASAKAMRALLEPCPDLVFAEPTVTVKGSLDDASRAALFDLARALAPDDAR